jgi:hypothetical protein
MLDSYQHHYLVSLVLFLFAFFPTLTAAEIFPSRLPPPTTPKSAKEPSKAKQKKKAREAARIAAVGGDIVHTSAWAYALVAFTCAVVYAWTAVSKTEPDRRAGHALREITRASHPLEPFETWFVEHGATHEGFWSMMGSSVILLQMVIALGYVLAPRRDTVASKLMPVVCGVALFAALNFHVGAEFIKLRIGWFSWYMIAMALVAFLPARALHWLLFLPAEIQRGILSDLPALLRGARKAGPDGGEAAPVAPIPRPIPPAVPIAMSIAAAILLVLMGRLVDVPGAIPAMAIAAIALVAGTVWASLQPSVRRPIPYVVAAASGALLMWLSIGATEVRYDFYRFMGGDARRRGEIEVAIESYEKAARYAPHGKWTRKRQERLDELRRRHAAGGTKGHDHGDE